MNELLETERAYVEELLCVLEVRGHCVIHSTFLHKDYSRFFPPCDYKWFFKLYLIEGLRGRDGQPRHGSSHPQQPTKQEGHSVWQYV